MEQAPTCQLASSMLDASGAPRLYELIQRKGRLATSQPDKPWDLTREFQEGIAFFDEQQTDRTLTFGKIIGITWMISDSQDAVSGSLHHWTHELVRHLVLKHIAKAATEYAQEMGHRHALIIHYYDLDTLSTAAWAILLHELAPDVPLSTFGQAVRAVMTTSFDDMLESIYEQLPATLEELERPAAEHHGLLVVIEGLEKATSEFERTWHISRAHDKLTELFRHLTYLSRKYSDRICIIVENLSGIHRTNTQYDPTAVVKSMFVPESLPATQNFPYMRGVFDCDMDQGVDAQLLVSKYNDSVVCEVTKDRTGDGLGRWCVL